MGFSEDDLKRLRNGPGVRAVHDPADQRRQQTPTNRGQGKQAPPTNRGQGKAQSCPAMSSSGTQQKSGDPRQRMNYTEQRYEDEFLWPLYREGMVTSWIFESVKLRLGDKCFYTPDFFVVRHDCFELVEIKGGFAREDAIAKFKSAVTMFPWFRWTWAQYAKREWSVKVYT